MDGEGDMDQSVGLPEHDKELLEDVLEGRYKLEGLIGRGAMSSVYVAWEYALNRRVAIKVLSPAYAGQLEDRERFRREARIVASFHHPNIVPVYAFEPSDGITFAVMPYIAGETLAERLHRERRVPPAEARALLAALAGALDCVHRHGVIHRDVKPGNVLLDARLGRPMLTDFGVATLTTSDHSRSEIHKAFGTPPYMSPEQALGEQECDGRSDLYALGVIGFHMLTGRLPFNGDSPRELAAQHVAIEPPPVSRYLPDVPADLEAIVARCLAKDPDDRWPDAARLARALGKKRARGYRWWRLWGRRVQRVFSRDYRATDSGAWAPTETLTLA